MSEAQVCFDVHERFGHLQAEGVQSRLFLASLYAGTDCDLPDPRLGVAWTSAQDFVPARSDKIGLLVRSWTSTKTDRNPEKVLLPSCYKEFSKGRDPTCPPGDGLRGRARDATAVLGEPPFDGQGSPALPSRINSKLGTNMELSVSCQKDDLNKVCRAFNSCAHAGLWR